MPYKKPNIEKIHFPIGEVAKMLNVAPSVLRYWEKEFSIIKPFKNAKGNRFYTNKDIDNLKLIQYLLKQKGLTIEGAKHYIKNKNESSLDKQVSIFSKLNNIKQELIGIKNNLNLLNIRNSNEQKQE
ncbi:MAG: MerR family transcriptional regulator [Bacteroidales bacterium]